MHNHGDISIRQIVAYIMYARDALGDGELGPRAAADF
jgi:hypothetical protein